VRLEARRVVAQRGGRRVLDGVSIAVEPGRIATLGGPSGGGKTTLLRILAGLAEADEGTVLLDGVDARTIAPRELRRRVAFVLQQPPMLEGTVAENVATGPRLRGSTIDAAAIARLLERVGLDASFASRPARDLSGGEKQRVALARALANDPKVILLDEPTSALDPASADRVLALVRALAEDGHGILVVTHIEEHAEALGGARYVCKDGKIA
jgi:putative ABC transport system ATP-binding protein